MQQRGWRTCGIADRPITSISLPKYQMPTVTITHTKSGVQKEMSQDICLEVWLFSWSNTGDVFNTLSLRHRGLNLQDFPVMGSCWNIQCANAMRTYNHRAENVRRNKPIYHLFRENSNLRKTRPLLHTGKWSFSNLTNPYILIKYFM